MGQEIGRNNGGLINQGCSDHNPPVSPYCKEGWMYWDTIKGTWKIDETITVECKGVWMNLEQQSLMLISANNGVVNQFLKYFYNV